MTYQEAIKKSKTWSSRVTLITLYHNKHVLTNPKWTQRITARQLGISLGAVSEALKLTMAMLDDPEIINLSRKEALAKLRNRE